MAMFRSFVLSSTLVASMSTFVACKASEATVEDTTSDESSSLGTSVDALTGAVASYEEVATTAKECFAAFETCVDAAGDDHSACKTTLEECLPEAPTAPEACRDGEGKGKGKGGKPPPPKGHEPPPKGHEKGANGVEPADDDDAAEGSEESEADEDAAEPTAAGKPPKAGGGKGEGKDCPEGPKGDGADGGGKEKPLFCGKVPLPPNDDVKSCKDAAKGQCKKGHHGGYDKCVKGAYDNAFAKACAEAKKACSGANAPADACSKVDALCAAGLPAAPEEEVASE